MTKSNVTISVETEIVEAARKKGVNISEACENGLYAALGDRKKGSASKIAEAERRMSERQKANIVRILDDDPFKVLLVIRIVKRLTNIMLGYNEARELYKRLKEVSK